MLQVYAIRSLFDLLRGCQLIETRHMTEDGACAVIIRAFNRSIAVSGPRDPLTLPFFCQAKEVDCDLLDKRGGDVEQRMVSFFVREQSACFIRNYSSVAILVNGPTTIGRTCTLVERQTCRHFIGKRDEFGSLVPADSQTGILGFLSMFPQYDHSRNRP